MILGSDQTVGGGAIDSKEEGRRLVYQVLQLKSQNMSQIAIDISYRSVEMKRYELQMHRASPKVVLEQVSISNEDVEWSSKFFSSVPIYLTIRIVVPVAISLQLIQENQKELIDAYHLRGM